MARRLALLLVAGVLLAGCGAPARPGDAPAPVPDERLARATGEPIGAYDGESCVGIIHLSELPSPLVQPELPEGYTAAYADVSAVAQVSLLVMTCRTVTVGNVTEANVTLAQSDVALMGGGWYRWEAFVEEPEPHAVVGLLQAGGWPALPAAIERTDLAYEVVAEGIRYTLTAGPQVGHPPMDPFGPGRIRHLTPDGRRLQLVESLGSGTQVFDATALDAQGGVWERIAGRLGGGPVAGVSQDINSSTLDVEVYAPGEGPA